VKNGKDKTGRMEDWKGKGLEGWKGRRDKTSRMEGRKGRRNFTQSFNPNLPIFHPPSSILPIPIFHPSIPPFFDYPFNFA
jgi:hypothetical protein